MYRSLFWKHAVCTNKYHAPIGRSLMPVVCCQYPCCKETCCDICNNMVSCSACGLCFCSRIHLEGHVCAPSDSPVPSCPWCKNSKQSLGLYPCCASCYLPDCFNRDCRTQLRTCHGCARDVCFFCGSIHYLPGPMERPNLFLCHPCAHRDRLLDSTTVFIDNGRPFLLAAV